MTTLMQMKLSSSDGATDMAFDEFLMDAKLHIETTGRDDTCSDSQVFPYEPTTYTVLDRLCESGLITGKDHIVDYGSGKGRAIIYIADRCGCSATGIELVRKFHEKAQKNLESYSGGKQVPIEFICAKAQDYELPDDATVLFFFNPFHFRTLKKVMTKILDSYKRAPRR
ncbi:MAG: class I SAM-dependent methyltransferase, partial [Lachnospiraceae bacterium]|nr:class I SAM-dependent methyltransferase [Lachnospiraceae bacterium]